jgi:hypothetical protein
MWGLPLFLTIGVNFKLAQLGVSAEKEIYRCKKMTKKTPGCINGFPKWEVTRM